jgi:hypothetical protein
MRPLSAVLLTVLGAATVLAGGAGHAAAAWTSGSPDATATYSTAMLAPATALSATARCGLSATAEVDLEWTATTSPQVTGYEVLRSTDGTSYSTAATLSDRTTTTYQDTTLATNATYTYLVRAVRHSWYVDTTSATITTPASCI